MEVCTETELIALEDLATVCDRAFQIGEGREVPVGERLIQNRPEVLSRLQVGRVARQVDEPDPVRNSQVGTVCQPALSSQSTMIPPRPAPASRANSASGKNGSVAKLRSRLWALWAPVTPWNPYPTFGGRVAKFGVHGPLGMSADLPPPFGGGP